MVGATLLKKATAMVWFCLVPCTFENYEVYFGLYKGDIYVNAVAKRNFVCVLSSGFSLLIFLKLDALSLVPTQKYADLVPQNLDVQNLLKVF